MINCSIHNYKEWIGAYIEGSLNREDMLSAEAFLQTHPQLMDAYLDELEEFSLAPAEVELDTKDQLNIRVTSTAHINANNFTQYFIGFYEGILDQNEQLELQSFLAINPKLQTEFKLYGSVQIKHNPSIQFPDKKDLLKEIKKPVPLFWTFSAAASILILIGVWFFWPTAKHNGLVVKKSTRIHFIENSFGLDKNSLVKNDVLVTNHVPFIPKKINHPSVDSTITRASWVPVETEKNKTAELIPAQINDQLALKTIPLVDTDAPVNELANNQPKKKGLLGKLFSGEKTYIEDYVNATFTVFKNNKEDDNKWVLKVNRDESGKSKKIKFSSPIFSVKSGN